VGKKGWMSIATEEKRTNEKMVRTIESKGSCVTEGEKSGGNASERSQCEKPSSANAGANPSDWDRAKTKKARREYFEKDGTSHNAGNGRGGKDKQQSKGRSSLTIKGEKEPPGGTKKKLKKVSGGSRKKSKKSTTEKCGSEGSGIV